MAAGRVLRVGDSLPQRVQMTANFLPPPLIWHDPAQMGQGLIGFSM